MNDILVVIKPSNTNTTCRFVVIQQNLLSTWLDVIGTCMTGSWCFVKMMRWLRDKELASCRWNVELSLMLMLQSTLALHRGHAGYVKSTFSICEQRFDLFTWNLLAVSRQFAGFRICNQIFGCNFLNLEFWI